MYIATKSADCRLRDMPYVDVWDIKRSFKAWMSVYNNPLVDSDWDLRNRGFWIWVCCGFKRVCCGIGGTSLSPIIDHQVPLLLFPLLLLLL